MNRGLLQPAVGEQLGPGSRIRIASVSGKFRFPCPLGPSDQFQGRRLDDETLGLRDEAETLPVLVLEGGLYRGFRAERHGQRRIGAVIAHMEPAECLHPLGWHTLGRHLRPRQSFQPLKGRFRLPDLRQRRLDRRLAQHPDVGEAHAISGQHAGKGVDQHGFDAERIGDRTGMLAARPAETVERIVRHIVAALDGNALDGVGHVLDGDTQEALRHGFRRAAGADPLGERSEFPAHDLDIERLVAPRPENAREELRQQPAEHEVAVGDRQRAAAPVAGGAGVRAGAVGPHPEAPPVEMQDRAASCGDGVDIEHRRTHPHAGDLGLEGALIAARIVRHIGRSAAHVEADNALETR